MWWIQPREESAELSPKQREAEGPRLLLHPPLMSSAGESCPVSPPCTMQSPSPCCVGAASGGCGSILPGAGCPPCPPTLLCPGRTPGELLLWPSCAGQGPQHPRTWIRSCFPVGSMELSAHTTFILHTIKKHMKKLYQKKKRKGASRTYLRCLNHPKVKTNLESKEIKLLL